MRFSKVFIRLIFISLLAMTFESCLNDRQVNPDAHDLTLFYINDPHGQLNNFAKIKQIVDEEKAKTNVLLVCAGDIFSGNPIVDQYSEKGYLIVDAMNKAGFDIAELGNHEFDYGIPILKDRMAQAEFDWICANVHTGTSVLPQPDPYKTLTVGDLKITVLGLLETNGKPDDIIPSTHPWRVADLEFDRYSDIVGQYQHLKEQEDADLFLALTHLGEYSDINLANEYPYFDLIIGGHTHTPFEDKVNGIPIYRAGSHLSYLGKLEITVKDKKISRLISSSINLNNYTEVDDELKSVIDEYNNTPEFDEVIGYAPSHLSTTELGCFYTTALKDYMNVDVSFQNNGGIRAELDEGDITKLDIYNMDPFNNGSVVFTMTVGEIKDFFVHSGAGMHVSGISFEKTDTGLIIYDEEGAEMNDTESLTIGINDYIPAVYDAYFSYDEAEIRELTTAESIIQYLKTINSNVDYEGCNQYFHY